MKESCACILIPHERPFTLVLWQEEWLVGDYPSTWNFGSPGPHWSKISDFKPIFARSASAITPSKKSSVNTNRKSTTSLRGSYVAPKEAPKEGSKTAVFHVKVCYKVSLCENCQWQSCKAFIDLTIREKWLVGDIPFCVKIWRILTHPLSKRRFSIYFCL